MTIQFGAQSEPVCTDAVGMMQDLDRCKLDECWRPDCISGDGAQAVDGGLLRMDSGGKGGRVALGIEGVFRPATWDCG